MSGMEKPAESTVTHFEETHSEFDSGFSGKWKCHLRIYRFSNKASESAINAVLNSRTELWTQYPRWWSIVWINSPNDFTERTQNEAHGTRQLAGWPHCKINNESTQLRINRTIIASTNSPKIKIRKKWRKVGEFWIASKAIERSTQWLFIVVRSPRSLRPVCRCHCRSRCMFSNKSFH